MYMALTEKDKALIQKMGVHVIEFKKIIYKLAPCINEMVEAGKRMMDLLSDLADEMRLCLDEIKDAFNLRTSTRYRFVKFFSKVGYDKRKLWVSTRRTWLARSNC